MSKRCTNCGTFLTETDRFCPGCGENAPVEVEADQTVIGSAPQAPSQQQFAQPQYNYNQPQYGQPQYNNPTPPPPYNPSAAPQYNPYQPVEEEMTVGKWIITYIVLGLPLVGFIFYFIWGFGSGPKARQTYCKACLILAAIGVALYILIFILLAVLGITMFDDSSYYYSGYEMAKNVMSMFS